jgi:hypothetical protein
MVIEVNLDEKPYVLTYDWNSRTDRWSLTIEDSDGDLLVAGITLVPSIDLLRTVASDARPGGALILYTFDSLAPTLETINKVQLLYVTEDEVGAV